MSHYQPQVERIINHNDNLILTTGKLIKNDAGEYLIISEDEKIEIGDYFYDLNREKIYVADEMHVDTIRSITSNYKILALSTQFYNSQIKDGLNRKMESGSEVYVECQKKHVQLWGSYEIVYQIKHNKNGHINILSKLKSLTEIAKSAVRNKFINPTIVEEESYRKGFIDGFKRAQENMKESIKRRM